MERTGRSPVQALDGEQRTETSLELEAAAGAAAIRLPVDDGGVVQYSTSGDFRAVLFCDADVVSEGFDFRDPFLAWIQLLGSKFGRRRAATG